MTKRKKSNRRATISSAFIFISVLFIVWMFVSCKDKNDRKETDDPIDINKQTENQVKEEKAREEQAKLEKEKLEKERIENERLEKERQEQEQKDKEKEEAVNNNKPPEGSDGKDVDQQLDSTGLSNKTHSWSFKRNSDHIPTIGYSQGIDLEKYNAYYKVDTEEKVIYLTFDEGYEYGLSGKILDILLENNVKAAFFVTKPFVDSNPELCKRMKNEGHVIGNHSVTHSSFPDLSNSEIEQELSRTNQAFLDKTGYELDPFFRTPSGNFSERVLSEVKKNGYRSIFWSLAYGDWDVNKQPGKKFVYDHIMENYHPGGIFLLHAVSQSNTEALDEVLKALKAEDYRFGSLYEIE